jgi:hypothetical protein
MDGQRSSGQRPKIGRSHGSGQLAAREEQSEQATGSKESSVVM